MRGKFLSASSRQRLSVRAPTGAATGGGVSAAAAGWADAACVAPAAAASTAIATARRLERRGSVIVARSHSGAAGGAPEIRAIQAGPAGGLRNVADGALEHLAEIRLFEARHRARLRVPKGQIRVHLERQ